MSSANAPTNHIDEREHRRKQHRLYTRLRREREGNDQKEERLARRRANYARRRQEIVRGKNILVGNQANLNEYTLHSNATTTCPLLIPPNGEVHHLAQNMSIEQKAIQHSNGVNIVSYL